MEQAYAEALVKAVAAGAEPKAAVTSIVQLLEKKGRKDLVPRVKRALMSMSERTKSNRTRLYVAAQKDSEHAKKESKEIDADVHVDHSIIGGWRLEKAEVLVDASYKRMLLDIYNRITA
jgi:F0F1-type ATP synthase delta subunit